MRLGEQWEEIESRLPEGWRSARVALSLAEDSDANRAALVLSSLNPGRTGTGFRLEVGPARRPGSIFERLDREGIRGRLDLMGTDVGPTEAPAAEPSQTKSPLSRQWEEVLADLPSDWSELYCELELDSTDFVARAALLGAPLNPARFGAPNVLRFRIAQSAGYGTAPEMAARCLERLARERITGTVRVLRVLSDTAHVSTQGPVWRVGGRSV